MKFNVYVDMREARLALGGLLEQESYATSKGINDIAVGLHKHQQSVLAASIDRPTRFTINSLFVQKGRKSAPTAVVGLKDIPKRSTHYLEPLIKGGSRHKKGAEIAFDNRWLAPGDAAKGLGLIDGYGNFRRSKIQQLLSYFGKAELSAGYSANSTSATRERMAKIKRTYWDAGAGKMKTVTKRQLLNDPGRGAKTIGGKQYFMSMGRGAGSRGQQSLAAGIWQKSGVHGVDVKPVLMQVKSPAYSMRFDFYGEAERWVAKHGPKIMSKAVAHAIQTARR